MCLTRCKSIFTLKNLNAYVVFRLWRKRGLRSVLSGREACESVQNGSGLSQLLSPLFPSPVSPPVFFESLGSES